jgi:hypothetical protein
MSLTTIERFSTYPAIFDAITLNDVVNVTPSAEIKKIVAYPGGSLDPGKIAGISRDPTVGLSIINLAQLANISPILGLACSSAVKIQYQQRQDGGAFQSGSNHVTMTSVKGMLLPESIQAQQDDQSPALLQLKYYGLKNGSTPAMAINLSQALTGTPGVDKIFKLGPVVIDGVILGGVQRSQVNFGLQYTTKKANGDTDPSVGSIVKRGATAEISAANISLANAADFDLIVCSTGIVIYFLDANELPASAAHISVTFPAGSTYELADVPAQGEQDAETRLMITAKGSVTVATNAVYPT